MTYYKMPNLKRQQPWLKRTGLALGLAAAGTAGFFGGKHYQSNRSGTPAQQTDCLVEPPEDKGKDNKGKDKNGKLKWNTKDCIKLVKAQLEKCKECGEQASRQVVESAVLLLQAEGEHIQEVETRPHDKALLDAAKDELVKGFRAAQAAAIELESDDPCAALPIATQAIEHAGKTHRLHTESELKQLLAQAAARLVEERQHIADLEKWPGHDPAKLRAATAEVRKGDLNLDDAKTALAQGNFPEAREKAKDALDNAAKAHVEHGERDMTYEHITKIDMDRIIEQTIRAHLSELKLEGLSGYLSTKITVSIRDGRAEIEGKTRRISLRVVVQNLTVRNPNGQVEVHEMQEPERRQLEDFLYRTLRREQTKGRVVRSSEQFANFGSGFKL